MGLCCGTSKKMMGNIIFKPIEANIEKCGDKDFDNMFEKISVIITKTEEVRNKIAEKFKVMVIETGACVLRRPCIERSLSSFILQIFIQVTKDLDGNVEKLKQFNYKALFEFKMSSPFFSFNTKSLSELKASLGINLDDNKDISKGKKAIFEFIECLGSFKDYFIQLKNQITDLISECHLFFKQIKNKLTGDESESITIHQATEYIKIAERNIRHVMDVKEIIFITNSFLFETVETIASLADKVLSPREILNLQKIASDAFKRKVYSPMEIVFRYSKYEKCAKIEDWQENITWKEISEDNEELRF